MNPIVKAAIIGAIGGILGAFIIGAFNQCPNCPDCPSNCITSIEHMEDVMMWSKDPMNNTSLNTKSVPALNNNGIQINYDINKSGFVAIYKDIKPQELVGTEGIKLNYMGSGEPNTLELILVLKNDNNEDVRFIYPSNNATQTNNHWRTISAPYKKFNCWDMERCKGKFVDPSEVYKVGIAISNKEGDIPGKGFIIVDELGGVTC